MNIFFISVRCKGVKVYGAWRPVTGETSIVGRLSRVTGHRSQVAYNVDLFVNLGGFAVEDFLAAHGEGEHFVFAFVDLDGSNPAHAFFNHSHPGFAIGDATGEDDGVDLAVDYSGEAANFHGDLIGEGVDQELAFLVAGEGFLLDLVGVIGAEVGHETTFGGDHLLQFGLIVLAAASHLDKFGGIDAAATGGGEGTEAAECAVDFDTTAMGMDTHADAAAHVGDDEVEILIVLAQLAGIELGSHLLVEAVPDNTFAARVEVEDGVAADFGELRTLVDDAGVGNIGAFKANLAGNGVADEGAEVACMLALDAGMALFLHEVVDLVAAALAGTSEAAAAHDDGDFVGADAVAFHHVEDGSLAILELVSYFVEFLNLFDGVAEVFGEDLGLAFVDGSLR